MTIPILGLGPVPDNLPFDLADMLATGKEFAAGSRRFRIKRVVRGSMSRVHGEVVPIIRQRADGSWRLGFYADPARDSQSHLLVAFELARVR